MARVADEQAERDRLETAMRGAKNEQVRAHLRAGAGFACMRTQRACVCVGVGIY
jgi:hypothetical protein